MYRFRFKNWKETIICLICSMYSILYFFCFIIIIGNNGAQIWKFLYYFKIICMLLILYYFLSLFVLTFLFFYYLSVAQIVWLCSNILTVCFKICCFTGLHGWQPFLEREDILVWRKECDHCQGLYVYKGIFRHHFLTSCRSLGAGHCTLFFEV